MPPLRTVLRTVAKRGRVVKTNREYFTYLFELLCTFPLEFCVFHMTLRLDLCTGSSAHTELMRMSSSSRALSVRLLDDPSAGLVKQRAEQVHAFTLN